MHHRLLMTALLMVASTAAVADTAHEEFFQVLETISPTATNVLRKVGQDYREKCGAEPTVEQYKELGRSSMAYSFTLAAVTLGYTEPSKWPSEAQAQYQAYLSELTCPERVGPNG